MDIKGVAAIVTGGASGLGNATARMLAANGAKVAIFDLNEDVGEAAARELGGVFVKVNVADDQSVTDGIAAAEKAHGVARILVNCAGVAPAVKTVGKENVPHSLDIYRKAIEVNLIGTFNVISKFAAKLAAADPLGEERGVIVNTASVAAYDGHRPGCLCLVQGRRGGPAGIALLDAVMGRRLQDSQVGGCPSE